MPHLWSHASHLRCLPHIHRACVAQHVLSCYVRSVVSVTSRLETRKPSNVIDAERCWLSPSRVTIPTSHIHDHGRCHRSFFGARSWRVRRRFQPLLPGAQGSDDVERARHRGRLDRRSEGEPADPARAGVALRTAESPHPNRTAVLRGRVSLGLPSHNGLHPSPVPLFSFSVCSFEHLFDSQAQINTRTAASHMIA